MTCRRESTRGLRALLVALLAALTGLGQLVPLASARAPGVTRAPLVPGAPATAHDPLSSTRGGVTSRSGAFTWSFPIEVPPGRLGVQPSLALGYSSQASVYGSSLGAGWSLSGAPAIVADTVSEGTGALEGRLRYVGPGGRLVLVDEPAPPADDVIDTFRAEHDATYARYERLDGSTGALWRVRSLDGGITLYGDPALGADHTRAPILSRTDVHGNSVEYRWEAFAVPGGGRDFLLQDISYTLNRAQGIDEPFARVAFVYAPWSACMGVAPGSSMSTRTGQIEWRGSRKLVQIRTEALGEGVDGLTLLPVREITLGYDPSAEACDALHGPQRQLASIQERAWDVVAPGQPATVTTTPPVTFAYGPLERPPTETITYPSLVLPSGEAARRSSLPNDPELGDSLESMLIDLNGDGRLDLVEGVHDKSCAWTVRWNDGQGFAADPTIIRPPRLPWALEGPDNGGPPSSNTMEGCNLAFQYTRFVTTPPDEVDHCSGLFDLKGSKLVYRFMDVDHDGLADLVTQIRHDMFLDPHSLSYPELWRQHDSRQEDWPACDGVGEPEMPSHIAFPDDQGDLTWISTDRPGRDFMHNGQRIRFQPATGDLTAPVVLPSEASPGTTYLDDSEGGVQCPVCSFHCGTGVDLEGNTYEVCCQQAPEQCLPPTPPSPPQPDYPDGPTPEGEFDTSCANTRFSHRRCQQHVWMVYKNLGDGQFDTEPSIRSEPVALDPNSAAGGLGGAPARYDLVLEGATSQRADIDGDGFADLVGFALKPRLDGEPPSVEPYDPFGDTPWLVYRGGLDGRIRGRAADGEPFFFSAPDNSLFAPPGNPYIWVERPHPSLSHAYSASQLDTHGEVIQTLADFNGDGLADLLWARHDDDDPNKPRQMQVFWNMGDRFEGPGGSTSMGAIISPRGALSSFYTDGTAQSGTSLTAAERHTTTQIVDIDGDGRADLFVAADPDTGTPAHALMHVGGRFWTDLLGVQDLTLSSELATALRSELSLIEDAALQPGFHDAWRIRSLFADIDGDGRPDAVVEDRATGQLQVTRALDDGRPQRLLHRIDNGRGGRLVVTYASSNDPSVVTLDTSRRRALPNPTWVVARIDADPGFGQPVVTTRHAYDYPVWSADDLTGKYAFRGFERTRSISGARVDESVYDYSRGPFGLVTESRVYDASTGEHLSVTTSVYQDPPLTPFGIDQLAVHAKRATTSYRCGAGDDYASCLAQAPRLTRTSAFKPEIQTGGGHFALFVSEQSRRFDGSGYDSPGDQRSVVDTYLLYGSDSYRVVETGTRTCAMVEEGEHDPAALSGECDQTGPGTLEVLISDHTSEWDAAYQHRVAMGARPGPGLPYQKVRTEYAPTGLPLRVYRPSQSGLTNGLFTSFEYDPFATHPVRTVNELGHQVRVTRYDYGRGLSPEVEGPSYKCPDWSDDPSGDCAESERTYRPSLGVYDGFGRMTQTYGALDDGNGYRLELLATTEYLDDAFVAAGQMTGERVLSRRQDDAQGNAQWNLDEVRVDGAGRTIEALSESAQAGDALVTFIYDERGRLVAQTLPDPSLDVGLTGTVTSSVEYDTFGRQIRVRLPDPDTGLPSEAGTGQSYDGLVSTAFEYNSDGRPPSVERVVADVFGRVVTRGSLSDDGLTFADHHYSYGPSGEIARVHHPDGIQFELTHDWLGQRTAIERHGVRWELRYDLDGHTTEIVSPYPAGADPADYTTTFVVDVLGRTTKVSPAVADLSAAELAELRVGTALNFYDEDSNQLGALNRSVSPLVDSFVSYDVRGLVTSQAEQLKVAPFDEMLSQVNLWDVSGRPTEIWHTDAHDPVRPVTVTQHGYDDRGRLEVLRSQLHDPLDTRGAVIELARVERNAAGVVLARQSGHQPGDPIGVSPVHSFWSFDKRGQLRDQLVATFVGGQSELQASQTLGYYDDGSVSVLENYFGGATNDFTFTYDRRDQLTTAVDDAGYAATLQYSFGERLTKARVELPGTASRGRARDVKYAYDAADPTRLSTLDHMSDGSPFAVYTYDAAGNVIDKHVVDTGEVFTYRYDGAQRLRIAERYLGGERQAREVYYYAGSQRVLAVHYDGKGALTGATRWAGLTEVRYDASGARVEEIVTASLGQPVARIRNHTEVRYLAHNTQNHLLVSLDADTGEIEAGYSFGPLGEVLEHRGDPSDYTRGFNDRHFVDTAGMAYHGHRFLDLDALRFNRPDPLFSMLPEAAGREADVYGYARNNPLSFTDPDGLQAVGALGPEPQRVEDHDYSCTSCNPHGVVYAEVIHIDGDNNTAVSTSDRRSDYGFLEWQSWAYGWHAREVMPELNRQRQKRFEREHAHWRDQVEAWGMIESAGRIANGAYAPVGATMCLLSGGIGCSAAMGGASAEKLEDVPERVAAGAASGFLIGAAFGGARRLWAAWRGARTASSTAQTAAGVASAGTKCFVAGTLVETPGGTVPIEQIASGDLIVAVDGDPRVTPELPVGTRLWEGIMLPAADDTVLVVEAPGSQPGWRLLKDVSADSALLYFEGRVYALRTDAHLGRVIRASGGQWEPVKPQPGGACQILTGSAWCGADELRAVTTAKGETLVFKTNRTLRRVARTLETSTTRLTLLDLEDDNGTLQQLRTTPDHRFWNAETGDWVQAGDLEAGALLTSGKGSLEVVGVLTVQVQPTLVYNMDVPESANYLVRQHPLAAPTRVHNGNKCFRVIEGDRWTPTEIRGDGVFLTASFDARTGVLDVAYRVEEGMRRQGRATRAVAEAVAHFESKGHTVRALGQELMMKNRDLLRAAGSTQTPAVRMAEKLGFGNHAVVGEVGGMTKFTSWR